MLALHSLRYAAQAARPSGTKLPRVHRLSTVIFHRFYRLIMKLSTDLRDFRTILVLDIFIEDLKHRRIPGPRKSKWRTLYRNKLSQRVPILKNYNNYGSNYIGTVL